MVRSGLSAGRKSGCPFCLARNGDLPKVGEKIRLLSDYRAGRTMKVVEAPSELPLRPGEILVEVDDDEPGFQQVVHTEWELIETLPGPPTPAWAPSISLREAEELDRIVLKCCDQSTGDSRQTSNLQPFYDLIRHVWQRRLPIEPKEIWAVLEAHGVPSNLRNRLIKLYKEGRELLVYAAGRKPIKKKRVPPLLFE